MRSVDEVRAALNHNFKDLMDCIGQLTEDELTNCAVSGGWTAKDVIAHVWARCDENVRTARAWRAARPWQEGVVFDDSWNEAQVANMNCLPLISVVDGITGGHRKLVHLLDMADDHALGQTGRSPWTGDEMTLSDFFYLAAEHYTEHIGDLCNYRERCLKGDGPAA